MRPHTSAAFAPAPAQRAKATPKRTLASYVQQLTPRLTRMAAYYARASRGQLERDDLLQEAWHGLIEAYTRLDERIGSPEQFLIRHARWRLLTYARQMRRRTHLPLEDAFTLRDPQLSFADLRLDLEASAAQLAQGQLRTLACLASGMTWREAAAALSCSSPNIAYHVRRIREVCAEFAHRSR